MAFSSITFSSMPISIAAVPTAIEYEYRFTEYRFAEYEYDEIRCDRSWGINQFSVAIPLVWFPERTQAKTDRQILLTGPLFTDGAII